MAAIDQAGKDLVALSGALEPDGRHPARGGPRSDEAAARYQEQVVTIDKADVPAQVKEATHRQALFDEARVALARHDVAGAKAKAAAYATAVAANKVPFEMRQTHELAGRIALEEKKLRASRSRSWPGQPAGPARPLSAGGGARRPRAIAVKAKQAGVLAADFNGLSPTYGYVRGKAKAMVTAPKKN